MDFKEYSAAFHAQNDDIMHYGVKGMKWDPSKRRRRGQTLPGPQAPRDVSNAYADKEDKKFMRIDSKYTRELSKLSSDQLDKRIRNRAEASDFDRVSRYADGSANLVSDKDRIARSILVSRQRGEAEEPKEEYKAKKETSLHKAAKKAARKKEKRRNKERTNARKAEQAYRRGGH